MGAPPSPPGAELGGVRIDPARLGTGATEGGSSVAGARRSAFDAWLLRWQREIDEWWASIPATSKEQMGQCMHALGLHLGSRLQQTLQRLGLAQRLPREWPPFKTAEGGRINGGEIRAEGGCDWLMVGAEQAPLQLPEFPQIPAQFELPAPMPVDWLMPRVREGLRVSSAEGLRGRAGGRAGGLGTHSGGASTPALVALSAGGVGGLLVVAVLVSARLGGGLRPSRLGRPAVRCAKRLEAESPK